MTVTTTFLCTLIVTQCKVRNNSSCICAECKRSTNELRVTAVALISWMTRLNVTLTWVKPQKEINRQFILTLTRIPHSFIMLLVPAERTLVKQKGGPASHTEIMNRGRLGHWKRLDTECLHTHSPPTNTSCLFLFFPSKHCPLS